MYLNHDKTEVLCHVCNKWHNIGTETLWLPRDDGVIDIVCMEQYPGKVVHLGFDHDLPE